MTCRIALVAMAHLVFNNWFAYTGVSSDPETDKWVFSSPYCQIHSCQWEELHINSVSEEYALTVAIASSRFVTGASRRIWLNVVTQWAFLLPCNPLTLKIYVCVFVGIEPDLYLLLSVLIQFGSIKHSIKCWKRSSNLLCFNNRLLIIPGRGSCRLWVLVFSRF